MRNYLGHARASRLPTLVAASAIVFAACSGGGSSQAPTAAPASAPTATAGASSSAAAEPLSGKLRVDFLAYDAKMQPWLDQVKADFNALHPDVELTLELPNLDQYRDSLTTQAQGGNPPDVAQVALSWMPALADGGVLDDWEAAGFSPDLLGQMEPALRDGARYQGAMYGLSYGASSRAVFYNTDAFTEAGITTPPATWDDFLADMRKLKTTGGVKAPFYYEGKGQEAMAAWFPYVYFAYGGELTDATGKLAIDKHACVKGLTVWDTMNKEGLLEANVTAGDFTGQSKAMSSGEAAATISGPWGTAWFTSDQSTEKFSTFPIPSGTTQATVGVTDVFALFKDSENKAAAIAFTEFLMDPERNIQFVKDRGFLPIYSSQFSLPDFATGPLKAFADALASAKFIPLNAAWTQFDKVGTDAITAMFLDGGGPDKACQAMIDGLAGIPQ